MFFSEEKNQKTFMFCATPTYPAKPRICAPARAKKSFGSFLQKRTVFSFLQHPLVSLCSAQEQPTLGRYYDLPYAAA
jgi:hypothetical protein